MPFIARYRSDATQGLTPSQIRAVDTTAADVRAAQKRVVTLLSAMEARGERPPRTMVAALQACTTVADANELAASAGLGAPQRATTLAAQAREKGYGDFADAVMADVKNIATNWVRAGFAFRSRFRMLSCILRRQDESRAGIMHLLAEKIANDPATTKELAYLTQHHATITAEIVKKNARLPEAARFEHYDKRCRLLSNIAAHDLLALLVPPLCGLRGGFHRRLILQPALFCLSVGRSSTCCACT